MATTIKKTGTALILSCMDLRVQDETSGHLQAYLLDEYDHVILAGAALGASHPTYEHWRKTFWDHVHLAIELHAVKELVIVEHEDCGAYKAFVLPESERAYIGKLEDPEARAREEACHHRVASALAKEVAERHGLETTLLYAALDPKDTDKAVLRPFAVPAAT